MLNIDLITGGSISTNCYILEKNKRVILIDFVPEVEKIVINKNFIIDKILITHIHFDHIEGLSSFQKKYNFELCLSKIAYDFIKNPDYNILSFFPPQIKESIININIQNANILKNEDIIEWDDTSIEILTSPGHSPECLLFILRNEKIVFTGDTIFNTSIGRTDLPGGNFELIIDSIKKLFSKISDDFTLYPGHGPKTTVYFEKNNNPFLTHFS